MKTEVNAKLKIGIIGAGVGGLSAGIMLNRLGHDVTIYEREKKLDSVGAGIQISSNGRSILEKIGLDAEVLKIASKPSSLCLFDAFQKNKIGSIEICNRLEDRYKHAFLVMHREDLINALYNEIKKEGIKIFFGMKAEPKKCSEKILISINNENIPIEKDLIIAADGVNSIWKKALMSENKFRPISQSAYRVTVECKYLSKQFVNDDINLFLDLGKHFVSYHLKTKKVVNFVFCKRDSNKTIKNWKKKISKETFFNEFGKPEILSDAMEKIKYIYKWPLVESEIPRTLTTKNVALVGDAAHGMLPYLAQGANKALEDSWDLCKLLQSKSNDLEERLNSYSKKRLERIKKLDKASVKNEKLYHLERIFYRSFMYSILRIIFKFLPNFVFWRLDWIYKFKV